MSNSWHPECFCCDICQQVFADNGFAGDYTRSFNSVPWLDIAFVREVEPGDVSGGAWDAESQVTHGMEPIVDAVEVPLEPEAVPSLEPLSVLEPRWYPVPLEPEAVPNPEPLSVPEPRWYPRDTEDVPAADAPGAGAEEQAAHGERAEAHGVPVEEVSTFSFKGVLALFAAVLLGGMLHRIRIQQQRQRHQCFVESIKARRAALKGFCRLNVKPAPNKAQDRSARPESPSHLSGCPAWVPECPNALLFRRPESRLRLPSLVQPAWPPSPATQKRWSRLQSRWVPPWAREQEPRPTPEPPLLRPAVALQIGRGIMNKRAAS